MKTIKSMARSVLTPNMYFFMSTWKNQGFRATLEVYSLRLNILSLIRKVSWRRQEIHKPLKIDIQSDEYSLNELTPIKSDNTSMYIVTANNNKKIVYTAIFGNYDALRDPTYINDDWDYVCFTDNANIKSKVFKIKIVEPVFDNNTKNARMIKVLSHLFLKGYDYSLWIDGSVHLRGRNINELIDDMDQKSANISVHAHSKRDCVYNEATTCIKLKKGFKSTIENQVYFYHHERMPENLGMVETAELLRMLKNDKTKSFNILWWMQLNQYSNRDQLSFNYISWKYGFKYNIIPGSQYDDPYFYMYKHTNLTQRI